MNCPHCQRLIGLTEEQVTLAKHNPNQTFTCTACQGGFTVTTQPTVQDPQEADQSQSLSNKQLRIITWVIALICAMVLPTGASTIAPDILYNPGKLNKEAATAMIQVFMLTGPLVLGVAFLTICSLRGWFANYAIGVIIGVCIAVLILGQLGFGMASETFPEMKNLGNPAITLPVFVLAVYAKVTGWPVTLASLALGWFVGLASNTKMPLEWQKDLDDTFKSNPNDSGS